MTVFYTIFEGISLVTTAYSTHPRYVEHDLAGHPEHAGRIRAIWQELDEAGLSNRLRAIEVRPLDPALARTVHTEKYLDTLARTQHFKQTARLDADTYTTPTSYEVALLAAGGVVGAVDAVLTGSADNGLAVVRPPGHHAMPNYAMGFCLLGNIAIAARHAQHTHHIERIMIVDYDVHHGNGTQAMFYDDESVLFVSTHQHPFYPGTGKLHDVGESAGAGYTLNIPLVAGHGDANYAKIFEQIIWPVAKRFQPELILVSAGFDAHWTDPLASMQLSLTGYDHITRELIRIAEEVCEGKIVFVVEGGYDLVALAHGVRNIAHALLGDDTISDPLGPANQAEPMIQPLIDQIRKIHRLEK